MSLWLFGYGSLIWRPDFHYRNRVPARLQGYVRRFWQGSHDHRGVPDAPGRVVTLMPDNQGFCDGVAYQLAADVVGPVLSALDHREKNGYIRLEVALALNGAQPSKVQALVYLATPDNGAYLGPAPLTVMARQIHHSVGPSGTNRDYLFDLAAALRDLEADDEHVFGLEAAVRGLDTAGDIRGHRVQS